MATYPLYIGWTELNGVLRSKPNSLGMKRDTPAETAASMTVFCLGTAAGAKAQITVSHPIPLAITQKDVLPFNAFERDSLSSRSESTISNPSL